MPGDLDLHLDAGGTVQQDDAGRGLVDVLAAAACGTDEGFLQIRFPHAKRRHAPGQRIVGQTA